MVVSAGWVVIAIFTATKSTVENAKYPKSIVPTAVTNVSITWFKKVVKLNVTCGNCQRCVWGTFPNVASHSVLLQKSNVRPTISASKNLHYRVNTEKSGHSSSQTCPSSWRPAPYSEKHLLAVSHWLPVVTVLDLVMWLVDRAVHLHRRAVRCRCGSASEARQLPLEDE